MAGGHNVEKVSEHPNKCFQAGKEPSYHVRAQHQDAGLGTVAEITWCSNPTWPVWCPRNLVWFIQPWRREDTTDEKWIPKCPGQCVGCADSDSLLCSVLELIISVSIQELAKPITQPLTPMRGQDTDTFVHGCDQVHTSYGDVSWPLTDLRHPVKRTERAAVPALLLEVVFLHGFLVWCNVHRENQSLRHKHC